MRLCPDCGVSRLQEDLTTVIVALIMAALVIVPFYFVVTRL